MDLSFIIVVIVIIGFFVLLSRSLKSKSATPKIKGEIGEQKVARILQNLDSNRYSVFNNVYISANGAITQIDHIVVSIYGIFVIETKNYKGWVFGHEKSEQWTLTLYNKKVKFRNPIKQNGSHVFLIKKALSNFKKINYHPIIVFVGQAELKKINSITPVVYIHQLIKTIEQERKPNMTIEEVKIVGEILTEYKINDRKWEQNHIQYVKNHVKERKKKIELLVCPNCGADLKVINGQYGKFYGCSNFPKCKFSKTL